MALPKPASQIDWVPDEAPAKAQEPGAGKKALGYTPDERPSPFEMNWLFARAGNWQKYFESITDEIVAGGSGFDAVVGSGPGTFADINAAVAAVSAGGRIFVSIPQALVVTQIVNKDDIELTFAPIAILTQAATLALGLQIDAERVRIVRPRFTDWDNNAADVVVEFTANSRNSYLDKPYFFNNANPAPIVNNGTNNLTINPIEEQ